MLLGLVIFILEFKFFFAADFFRRRFFWPLATFADGEFVFELRSNTKKPQSFSDRVMGNFFQDICYWSVKIWAWYTLPAPKV